MAAIGPGWEAGAWIEASWISTAWGATLKAFKSGLSIFRRRRRF